MGEIFDIKRMSVNDGPGIRTTVFLKGCPLCCAWCHNPESQCHGPELCARMPEPDAGVIAELRAFNRLPTAARKLAAHATPANSDRIEVAGREVSVEEVVAEVLEDAPFFARSGGGVTLSGGEPLAQPQFAIGLLRAFSEAGIHTLLDTCGAVPPETLRETVPWVRLYHFDIKETREEKHLRFTGAPLAPILENLALLDEAGAAVILRCPVIPGFNDDAEHLRNLGALAERFSGVLSLEIMPYHEIGLAKYTRLGRSPRMDLPEKATPAAVVESWLDIVRTRTRKPVCQG